MDLTAHVKESARKIGFDLVRIAPAGPAPRSAAFEDWIRQGRHASMDWIARHPERRTDPRRVFPGARAVVTLGLSYYSEPPPPELWNDPSRGRIARYAWGRDYHKTLRPLLQALCAEMQTHAPGPDPVSRYYCDTGPVLERETAWQGGLGFIGKNTLLIHPEWGSTLFLAEILTQLPLIPDPPSPELGATHPPLGEETRRPGTCGGCTRCLDHCPTHAFPAAHILDSRLCISYLTIEHRGTIDPGLRGRMENWIFGCDACQEVCPWVRRFGRPGRTPFLAFDPDLFAPRLDDVLALDEETFRARYRGTPVLRAKYRGFLRNATIAAGNSEDRALHPALQRLTRHPDPLLREHAEWALRHRTPPRADECPRPRLPSG